jgi:1,4-dihydroxy-2-naphthoate polyprenyltransferase
MDAFVTLTHDDPELRKYLLGNFSKKIRALPVESFSQHSSRERVTFRLIEVGHLKKPSWWKIYFKACRPELLGLTLGPFLITVMWMQRELRLPIEQPYALLAAFLGLFFLHVSAFLFNDFRDHMRGVDFANRRRGSQVIQKGWASASEVRMWALVNAGAALLFGIPAIALHLEKLWPIVLMAAALVMALSWVSSKLAKVGLSDLLVFFGLGPLLAVAASISAFGFWKTNVLFIGTAFGCFAVLTLEIRQLENLFRAGKDSFRTFIGGFEFDRAKALVLGQIVFVGGLQVAIGSVVFAKWISVFGFVLALIPLGQVYTSIRKAASPISSDLIHIGRAAILAQAACLVWWGIAVWI